MSEYAPETAESVLDTLAEVFLDHLQVVCRKAGKEITRDQAETMLMNIGTRMALRQLRRTP